MSFLVAMAIALMPDWLQLSSSVASDLFRLFDGRKGKMIAANGELILAYSMVCVHLRVICCRTHNSSLEGSKRPYTTCIISLLYCNTVSHGVLLLSLPPVWPQVQPGVPALLRQL